MQIPESNANKSVNNDNVHKNPSFLNTENTVFNECLPIKVENINDEFTDDVSVDRNEQIGSLQSSLLITNKEHIYKLCSKNQSTDNDPKETNTFLLNPLNNFRKTTLNSIQDSSNDLNDFQSNDNIQLLEDISSTQSSASSLPPLLPALSSVVSNEDTLSSSKSRNSLNDQNEIINANENMLYTQKPDNQISSYCESSPLLVSKESKSENNGEKNVFEEQMDIEVLNTEHRNAHSQEQDNQKYSVIMDNNDISPSTDINSEETSVEKINFDNINATIKSTDHCNAVTNECIKINKLKSLNYSNNKRVFKKMAMMNKNTNKLQTSKKSFSHELIPQSNEHVESNKRNEKINKISSIPEDSLQANQISKNTLNACSDEDQTNISQKISNEISVYPTNLKSTDDKLNTKNYILELDTDNATEGE